MQTQLYPAALHLNLLLLKARIAPVGRGYLCASDALFLLSPAPHACPNYKRETAVVKTIRRAKSYFLVLIMAKKQHTRNISRDNREKLVSNLKEAVSGALCRHGV